MAPTPRWPIILRVIFRIIAGSSLVPAFLVVGLLSFPSSCQCGAALPHDHSLFALASHSHVHPPTGGHHHGADTIDDSATQQRASEVRLTGPAFQVATDVARGQARAICLPLTVELLGCVTGIAPVDAAVDAVGRVTIPDIPPPKV
jgi:hypothetical protein